MTECGVSVSSELVTVESSISAKLVDSLLLASASRSAHDMALCRPSKFRNHRSFRRRGRDDL